MNINLYARFTQPFGPRFVVEWLAVGCLSVALIWLSSVWRLTADIDQLIYEHLTPPYGREIYPTDGPRLFLLSLAPAVVLLAGIPVLSPWRSRGLMAGLCMGSAAASTALLHGLGLWVSPLPAVLGMIVVYPLWNWRHLDMTRSYLRQELQRLADATQLLPEAPRIGDGFDDDALEQHMTLMAQTAQRMRDMKRFVWDSINNVAGPIMVSNQAGVVLIANHAARTYFSWLDRAGPEGSLVSEILGNLRFVKTPGLAGRASVEHAVYAADDDALPDDPEAGDAIRAHWPASLDPTRLEYAEVMAHGIEVRDHQAREYVLRYTPYTDTQGRATGWIVSLVDVSALHAAERKREEALALLSHDMRSPQSSIVALLEIERTYTKSDRLREVLDRIQRYAQHALELADDFVQQTRAESQTYALEVVSLVDLATVAGDEVWPQAHAKRIQLKMQFDDKPHWIRADPPLLTRALVNLLYNAVKYSPPRTEICCSITLDDQPTPGAPTYVQCTISDQGYGISAEQQDHLFEHFRRFRTVDQSEARGTGLGMAFVKTVATRHGGDVRVYSEIGTGTAFTLTLPALGEIAE